MSRPCGTSDHRSRLRSDRSIWSVRPTFSSKTASARRAVCAFTSRGRSAPAGKRVSNWDGRRRMKAASNSASSVSRPAKMRTCVRSAGSCGVKCIRPRPSSTTAVGPSSVSATNAAPDDMSSDRSGARSRRSWTENSRVVSSPSRKSPVMAVSRTAPTIPRQLERRGARHEIEAPGEQPRLDVLLDEHLDQHADRAPSTGIRSRSCTTSRSADGWAISRANSSSRAPRRPAPVPPPHPLPARPARCARAGPRRRPAGGPPREETPPVPGTAGPAWESPY
jgi:hypothetical protein